MASIAVVLHARQSCGGIPRGTFNVYSVGQAVVTYLAPRLLEGRKRARVDRTDRVPRPMSSTRIS